MCSHTYGVGRQIVIKIKDAYTVQKMQVFPPRGALLGLRVINSFNGQHPLQRVCLQGLKLS